MLSPNDKYYQSIVINQLLEFLYLHPLRRIVTETTFNLYDPTIHDRDTVCLQDLLDMVKRIYYPNNSLDKFALAIVIITYAAMGIGIILFQM
jgi:hypothetical protein